MNPHLPDEQRWDPDTLSRLLSGFVVLGPLEVRIAPFWRDSWRDKPKVERRAGLSRQIGAILGTLQKVISSLAVTAFPLIFALMGR